MDTYIMRLKKQGHKFRVMDEKALRESVERIIALCFPLLNHHTLCLASP